MELMEKKKTGLNLSEPVRGLLNQLVRIHGQGKYRVKGAVLSAAIIALGKLPSKEASELIDRTIMANLTGRGWTDMIDKKWFKEQGTPTIPDGLEAENNKKRGRDEDR